MISVVIVVIIPPFALSLTSAARRTITCMVSVAKHQRAAHNGRDSDNAWICAPRLGTPTDADEVRTIHEREAALRIATQLSHCRRRWRTDSQLEGLHTHYESIDARLYAVKLRNKLRTSRGGSGESFSVFSVNLRLRYCSSSITTLNWKILFVRTNIIVPSTPKKMPLKFIITSVS